MKFNKRLQSLLCAAMVLCMHAVPVQASSYSHSTNTDSQGRIGAVDIELHQTFLKEQTTILPGQKVDLGSSVENKGKPAWIRVKLEYPASAQKVASEEGKAYLQEFDDDLVKFADGDWEKIGSYFYYKKAVKTGATIPFTESITFPSDWDNSMVEATMGVMFTAEAVQEKNFEPDFKSKDPWHGTVIEAFDADKYQQKSDGTEKFSVVYNDGVEGLIHIGDDFFDGWNELMPGDKLDGTAVIFNRMKIPVRGWFEMVTEGDQKTLDAITITIKNGNDVIYDGKLSGKVSPAVMFKEYAPNDKTEFTYQLSVPKEMNNVYALSDFKVKMIFSAQEMIPETVPEKAVEVVEKTVEKVVEVVKTGEVGVLAGAVGLTMAIGGAVCLVYRKRKGRG